MSDATMAPWTPAASAQVDAALAAGNDMSATAEPNTDLGNAERFARQHGGRVAYVHPWRTWLVWDGARWARDRDAEVVRLARQTVRAIYAEAANASTDGDRRALAKHAMLSEGERRIAAMLELAKSDRAIARLPEAFDYPRRCHYLFNVANGTLDLITGELRAHRRDDYITKLAPITYDPQARAHLWEGFLSHCVPDLETQAFLRRYAGSALSGDIGDQIFALLYGLGANGKTTLIETLLAALGDYGHHASFETFLHATGRADQRGAPRADLLALRGVRLVAAVEAGEGRRLDENTIKQITGGDAITTRGLYHADQTTFTPEAKLLLACNAQPEIRGGDLAIWRRVLQVPFTVTIPAGERDPDLMRKLREPGELSGILNWLMVGCREWLAAGRGDRLRPPKTVLAATASYREQEDILGPFIADRCALGPDAWVATSELRKSYLAWCEDNGDKRPLSAQAMAQRLRDRGCVAKPRQDHGKARGWAGIRLRATGEGAEAADGAEDVAADSADGSEGHSPELSHAPAHEGVMENSHLSVRNRPQGEDAEIVEGLIEDAVQGAEP